MPTRVLVAMAAGFEEIETATIVDVLRRAGCEVVLAGLEGGLTTGSRGLRVMPDALLRSVAGDLYDALVLPGGMPNAETLAASDLVLDLIRRHVEAGRAVAAICAAPLALERAGVVKGKRVTSHPSVKERLPSVTYSARRVERDGKILTSRAPATALEFALALVELLLGPGKADEVAAPMLALR